jgi:uncharacterized membrane protein
VVEKDFWENTKEKMASYYKNGRFTQGLIEGILMAGEKLRNHFPYDEDSDQNELPDEISFGK